MRKTATALAIVMLALGSAHSAQTREVAGWGRVQDDVLFPARNTYFEELPDGSILVADAKQQLWFAGFIEYVQSPFFQEHGLRCAHDRLPHPFARGAPSDCSDSSNSVLPEYEPGNGPSYVIPVVFHVLRDNQGGGDVSDTLLDSQIDVLNEDFASLTDCDVTFELAGVTRSNSGQWYNDKGSYWDSLAWDVNQYLNIYTNTASGNLGYAYVPNGGGVVGNTWDRVVLHWAAVGRPAPFGPPYHLGRSATHEVGHYLGLYHTFDGGCVTGSSPACHSNGDLICDTNPESQPNFSPCTRTTCGSLDPTSNYMDYSDDVCMDRFTSEQANRMRCTLANYRTGFDGAPSGPPGPALTPTPTDDATEVSTRIDLSWNPGANAASHDVYFGTDPTPDAGELQGNQPDTTFDPGVLESERTYYWRIDEVNGDGTTTGAVWSFTTGRRKIRQL